MNPNQTKVWVSSLMTVYGTVRAPPTLPGSQQSCPFPLTHFSGLSGPPRTGWKGDLIPRLGLRLGHCVWGRGSPQVSWKGWGAPRPSRPPCTHLWAAPLYTPWTTKASRTFLSTSSVRVA